MVKTQHHDHISLKTFNEGLIKIFTVELSAEGLDILSYWLDFVRVEQTWDLTWADQTIYLLVEGAFAKLVFFQE